MKKVRHCAGWGVTYEKAFADFDTWAKELEAKGWRREGELQVVGAPNPPGGPAPFSYSISQNLVRGYDDMRIIGVDVTAVDTHYGSQRVTGRQQALTDLPVLDFLGIFGQSMRKAYPEDIMRWFHVALVIEVGDVKATQLRALDNPHFSMGVMLRERGTEYITLAEFAAILEQGEQNELGQKAEEAQDGAQDQFAPTE